MVIDMKKDRNVLRGFVMVSQIGISMMVPIFLCAGAGWWLDHQFHMQVWFLILLFVGIGAAFRNVYIMTRSFYAEDMKKEHDRLQYVENLKRYSESHPQEDFSDVMEGKKKRYPDHRNDTGKILSETERKDH